MRIPRFFAFAGALALFAGTLSDSSLCAADARAAKKIIVIAHRGAHREVPENTLAALARAIEIGCDYVEIDVRRTKDGALVIMHDATVNRMTDGKGKIEDLTLDEIKKLRVNNRRNESPTVVHRVPTFDEILDRAKGHMKIYVDHKNAPPADVLAAIEKRGMLEDVVVYGSVHILTQYKKLAPRVWIMPDHPVSLERMAKLAKELRPETLDGSIPRWTRRQVEAAHKAGIQVWVDNVSPLDNEPGVKAAVDLGVDAIQTDDPQTVVRILADMGLRGKPAR